MLTYNGSPIRRLLYLWQNKHREAVYLVETWEPRRGYHVPLGRIGTDAGVGEVLRAARLHGGQILSAEDR